MFLRICDICQAKMVANFDALTKSDKKTPAYRVAIAGGKRPYRPSGDRPKRKAYAATPHSPRNIY